MKLVLSISIVVLIFLNLNNSFSQLPIFERPCGIYVLGSARAGIQAKAIRPYSFIDGYAMRMKWKDIEPTQGTYDFSIIDTAINQLQVNGQKLTLAVFLKDPPTYIPHLPNAETYWDHKNSNPNDSTLNILPWDTISLPYVNSLLDNLASHLVLDQITGDMVAFKDHPVFAQIGVSFPGLEGIRDVDHDITGHPSYNRNTFTNSTLSTIQTFLDIFPNQFHYLAFFGISDGITNPKNLKNHLLDEINLAFNSGAQPQLGYFAENLACSTPNANPNQVLFSQKNITFTMMQMLESWRTPHQNNGAATVPCISETTGPDVAMDYALNNFNTTYFEIYLNDIEWIQYNSLFTEWQDTLQNLCNNIVSDVSEKIAQSQTIVFPNPNNGFFTIKSETEIYKVEIFDYSGKILLEKAGIKAKSKNLNISDIPIGMYYIKLFNQKGFSTHLLVKSE